MSGPSLLWSELQGSRMKTQHRHVADAHHLTLLDRGPCAKQESGLTGRGPSSAGVFLNHAPQRRRVVAGGLQTLQGPYYLTAFSKAAISLREQKARR